MVLGALKMTNAKWPFAQVMQAVNGDMVEDADTAIGLASVLIRRRSGEEFLKIQQPLSARDDGEFWWVDGASDAFEEKTGLGSIHIQLKKADASVAAMFCWPAEQLKKLRPKGRQPSPKK